VRSPSEYEVAKKRLADAEGRLKRIQDPIAAGIDPSVVSMRSGSERAMDALFELDDRTFRAG
jgi:hypothetical protein